MRGRGHTPDPSSTRSVASSVRVVTELMQTLLMFVSTLKTFVASAPRGTFRHTGMC
jgi:hypothetical protein